MTSDDLNHSQENSPAIEFRHVSMSFEEKCALDDVSLTVQRGEMALLTGESGSGKSTLLHLAMGLIRPDEGQIFINGREIESLREEELLALRGGLMGMVFQEEALFTGLTVYDNVAYRPREHGWPEEKTGQAVLEVLRFVGLENEPEMYPEELSGGMRRRLEIARALVGWPSIMLYDEPTSYLDPLTATQILDLAIRARDLNGISSIYVTKELHEIPYLATHRASEGDGGRVSIREVLAAEPAPKTKVLLVEAGRIVWAGSHVEFGQCALPSVRRMTHPERDVCRSPCYIPDPWNKSRKPREKIL